MLYAAEDEGKGRVYSRMKLVVGDCGPYGHNRGPSMTSSGFSSYQSSNLASPWHKAMEAQNQLVVIKCPVVTSGSGRNLGTATTDRYTWRLELGDDQRGSWEGVEPEGGEARAKEMLSGDRWRHRRNQEGLSRCEPFRRADFSSNLR